MENEIKEIMSLLGEMNKKFDVIDKRFDEMDKRFDAMDKRFETLETEVKGMKSEMETGFKDVHRKLDSIQSICQSHKYDLDLFYEKRQKLERKVNKVEKIQDNLF